MPHKKEHRYKGAHPYTVWSFLGSTWYILLLPLIQNLLYAPKSLVAIITNFGLNILFVILLFSAIVLETTSIKYREKDFSLYAKMGFLFKRRADIPYESIHSVTVQKNLFPMIFNAQRVSVNTPSMYNKNSDYSLYVSSKKARGLRESIFTQKSLTGLYRGGALRIIIMSAFWSNSLTGMLILVPMLNKISSLIGAEAYDALYQKFDISSYVVAIGVPPAIAGLATILLIGWGVAFVVQICRYAFFKSEIHNDNIVIRRGIFNRVDFLTKKDKINAITIKQSIPMMILNLKTVCIHAIGAGIQKGDKSVLMPADRDNNIDRFVGRIFKKSKEENKCLKVRKQDVMAYLWFPIYSLLGAIALGILLYYFHYFGEIIRFPYFVLIAILLYWLFFRIYCQKKAKISVTDEAVRIDYFKRLNTTCSIIPYDKIQFINVYQGPPQRIFNTAHIRIYIYSQHKEYFKIKHLTYPELQEIVKIINDNIDKSRLKNKENN